MRLFIRSIRFGRLLNLLAVCLLTCLIYLISHDYFRLSQLESALEGAKSGQARLLQEKNVEVKPTPLLPLVMKKKLAPRYNFMEVPLDNKLAPPAAHVGKDPLPVLVADEGGADYANQVLDSPSKVLRSAVEVVKVYQYQNNQTDLTGGEPTNEQTQERRNFIRNMTLKAWTGYRKYAWGHNELRPLTKKPHDPFVLGKHPLGATILDSIDTLYIMGLTAEYEDAKKWIAEEFKFNMSADVSVFETTIRVLGGLLTMYSFTKDEMFLTKAKMVTESLLPAFDTPTGLPYSFVNLATKHVFNYQWAPHQCSILAEVGTLHMEFQYLSELTGDLKYSKLVHNIREKLVNMSREGEGGFFFEFMSPTTGHACSRRISLGGLSDSFYEYLLKESLRTDGEDAEARRLYDASLASFDKINLIQTAPSGSVYASESVAGGFVGHVMEHLACFSGGMFALGALDRNSSWFKHGEDITATCHKSYAKSDTHLGPEMMRFDSSHDAVGISASDRRYLLRPETVESYFYLWRLTHDPKYREWAWDVAQALEKFCYTGDGYSGLTNVYSTTGNKDDVQQTYFIAETLKYLYLIFSEDSLLPLQRWVFNTEAHPFPVRRKHSG